MTRVPSKLKPSIAVSSLIPLDAMDGSKPYADFVNQRAAALAEVATKLIKTGTPA
jgi:hypothetical protein